ncbi:unnamed protein product [Lathyrus oleraceus]|uniref:Uncharacterized protein n=1 Tax=Pisum sativum TaxID=3888 RepID=A0A9D4XMN3_PEA|nr:lysine-specific demethylase JMJ25-like isoform X1 [Pisum sativum]XP_050873228.1 lysine-specific demethylase JMJ25-like isoform X1 [Pisum sativum]XP_050873229.1 lysine-specific demethylase JMJ25-like isoform X1 [Pisum sativum]XP_050873230.1 lysine-specific demethylase JMJ25-like isoform X1 [Pisum sativum]XP_050873231.1 lysine-specific demethylase JMJ25-like isoform X1 [Pisum sativum]XP_050873232.1 lysine-specific demethylase JMJ25-like isoform X1 [Pisum sativum]XP_050873233.1 lysine-specifi
MQETKQHKKYLDHWSKSCLSKRPQPEERQPERVQDVLIEEPIEVEHHNLDDEERQPKRVQDVLIEEPIMVEHQNLDDGLSVSKLCIAEQDDSGGDQAFCDNCKTSIFALHKHCQTCNSDFCLACCRDFCDAQLRGGADPIESRVTPKHGVHKRPRSDKHEDSDDRVCCDGFLELRSFYPPSHIADLVDEAAKLVNKHTHHMPMIADKTHKNLHSSLNRKAASREESSDNDIYCPKAKNADPKDLLHFQWHWRKGEPVIVRDLLGGTYNSLWEPSGMSRAIRLKHKTVKAIDCLSLHQEVVNTKRFFTSYTKGWKCSNKQSHVEVERLASF